MSQKWPFSSTSLPPKISTNGHGHGHVQKQKSFHQSFDGTSVIAITRSTPSPLPPQPQQTMTPPPMSSQPHQYQYSYIYSPINVQSSQPPPPPPNWSGQYPQAQFVPNWPNHFGSFYGGNCNFAQSIPPPPGTAPPAPGYNTTFDTKKSTESIPLYSDDSFPPPPPPPPIERLEDGQLSTPRGAAMSDDMIAMPHDDSSPKYDDDEPWNVVEGTYSDNEHLTKTKQSIPIAKIQVSVDMSSQSLTNLDAIKSPTKSKSVQLSLTNTNSNDTEDDFSDSETSIFSKSKSKSIIFLTENENEDENDNKSSQNKEHDNQKGNENDNEETKTETKKEEDYEATIKEYEEYIKKHNKRKKKKKRSKKRKQYNSPLVITESNSSHLWDLYSFDDAMDIPMHIRTMHQQALLEEHAQIECDEDEEEVVIKTRTKKKKSLKKKRSKEKLLSPITKTSCRKTTLRRSSTHKKNDPEYRKMQREKKEMMNLSRMGFKIKTKNRYRLDDGRIGICKFRGRTAFGKPHEDWVGLMIEHGDGAHNGTVDDVSYFRCAPGKGIMVRPERIIECMGLPDGYELTPKMIRGSKSIRKLLEDIAFKKEQDLIYGD